MHSFKSAIRNFAKNRAYGSLNILGLSIAFASTMLIAAYLHQETSYETCHENADRIYRPTYNLTTQSEFNVHFARIPVDYINHLPEHFPEIEKLIRFQNQEQKYIRVGVQRFKPKHAYITDADVFDVFTLPLVHGNRHQALKEPHSVVLSESTAKKYFSRINVLGEEITVSGDWAPDEATYKVTGVMRDLPVNTHLPIEILFSFTSDQQRNGWAYIYTLLAQDADITSVNAKMPQFIREYTTQKSAAQTVFDFQPLKDIHLHSDLAREIIPNGSIQYVRIFFWVGLFIWIIAMINFANLSTALAMGRGKEVGVRKVLGASDRNLMMFSLSESILHHFFALFIGGLIGLSFFSAFSKLTGVAHWPPLQIIIPALIGLAILSGLIAGVLPALVIASVKVLHAIKQHGQWSMTRKSGRINVKRALLTAQFCATVILIVGAFAAFLQFKFIHEKNLGLSSEQIIAITEVPDHVTNAYPLFKSRLQEIPGIIQVAACMQTPSSEIRDVGPVLVRGVNEDGDQAPMMDAQVVDPDFIEMMEIEIAGGINFTSEVNLERLPKFNETFTTQDYIAQAPRKYLINETAMRQLGWQSPDEAIGQEINWSIGNYKMAYGPITGVVKDFHQESLKNQLDPIIMFVEPLFLGNFLIKVKTRDLPKTLASIEDTWNAMFPIAFEYSFLDEMYGKLYAQDRVQLKLLSALAFIAILISFIGLVSLVAYALKRRSKELAIRRVIGADLKSLTVLIGKEYFWVITVATFIAVPLSYYWTSVWLQNFAYHINLSPMVYVFSVLSIYLLLVVTILLQTRQATVANPVEALHED